MTDETSQAKRKRLSKGWRKHVRRLKAVARKGGAPFRGTGQAR